jgi:hypothetical protein
MFKLLLDTVSLDGIVFSLARCFLPFSSWCTFCCCCWLATLLKYINKNSLNILSHLGLIVVEAHNLRREQKVTVSRKSGMIAVSGRAASPCLALSTVVVVQKETIL